MVVQILAAVAFLLLGVIIGFVIGVIINEVYKK
jgi:hypothetical protein